MTEEELFVRYATFHSINFFVIGYLRNTPGAKKYRYCNMNCPECVNGKEKLPACGLTTAEYKEIRKKYPEYFI